VTSSAELSGGGLFAALVDDAGLFPPADLPMRSALERHQADLANRNGVLSHRFVCPVGRLSELQGELEHELSLSLITPLSPQSVEETLERISGDDRLSLAALEGLCEGKLAAVEAPVPIFVEVPLTGGFGAVLDELAAAGLSAKVRCGGLRQELFPTRTELGAFIASACKKAVSFKATAGLHHALCYRDESTGFYHHGFLNLLLATTRALQGAERKDVIQALGEDRPEVVVTELGAMTPEAASRARQLFFSYGSCSTSEPIEDLERLGLIPTGAGRR
jgi:hypothetical protein